ncbi:MAG: M20/M25/M40 family metallo-hydrolase [Christensenellales bacterium]|jgi:tripeptide aminopeptidase
MTQDRLVERFIRYVSCDSESRCELPFCRLIEDELKALGLEVIIDPVGPPCGSDGYNIIAKLPGTGEPLLFCAHLDTVALGKGIRPIVEDGIIRSSGNTILGADDKSGVAAVMEALQVIVENNLPHRPIEVLFTICEEVGLLGSKHADYSKISAKEAVVLDSSLAGCIVNRAPAMVVVDVCIKGKAAHAAVDPKSGIHAIKVAADAIAAIPCGNVDENSTINVANLLAPGKYNIVPEKATFQMDIRSFEEETLQEHILFIERALSDACDKYGASFTMAQQRHSDVLFVPEDSEIIQCLIKIYERLGIPTRVERTFGGSDASWLNANGIAAVNIGTGMTSVHGVSEQISITDLVHTKEVVLSLATEV